MQFKYHSLIDALFCGVNPSPVKKAMELLHVFELDDKADFLASNLPYGDQRKLEIARALATEPKLLLLDEPSEEHIAYIKRELENAGCKI